MKSSKCPICGQDVPLAMPTTEPFRCPGCGERLHIVEYGTSGAAQRVIEVLTVSAVMFFGYRSRWVNHTTLAVLTIAVLLVVNLAKTLLSGYRLEPAERLELGQSDAEH